MLLLKVRFPFYEFYYQILSILLNLVKVNRMRDFPAFEHKNEQFDFLKKYDSRFLLKCFRDEGALLLAKISLMRCPSFELTTKIDFNGFQATLTVPDRSKARFLECRHSIATLLRLVSWSNFIRILTAIFCERHVVFVHPDREIVAHLMSDNQTFFH